MGLLVTGFFHSASSNSQCIRGAKNPVCFGDTMQPTCNVPKYNIRKTNCCLQTPFLMQMEFPVNPGKRPLGGKWKKEDNPKF